MRFKTDENLPQEIAGLLTQAGHDAVRVDEQGLWMKVGSAFVRKTSPLRSHL